jgi:alpha-tubulin suppressor-like RCC1 family protein
MVKGTSTPAHIVNAKCGSNFTIAIDKGGKAYSWGYAEFGNIIK